MKSEIFGLVCGIALIAGPVSAGPALSQSAAVTVSDDTLTERIETRVHQDKTLKPHDVRVSVDHGVATLTGTVATSGQKTHAATLAHVKGITRVDNKLVVDASHAANVGTKGTKEAVKDAGEKTKDVAKEVGEKTKDGAVKVAEKTKDGAVKVGNEVTDAWILGKVKAQFVGEDVLKGSDINVDCDKHIVRLRGTVPTAAGKARALQIANSTEGVQHVIDELTIGPKK
jgi:osmotically-inducible protein OsmY